MVLIWDASPGPSIPKKSPVLHDVISTVGVWQLVCGGSIIMCQMCGMILGVGGRLFDFGMLDRKKWRYERKHA